MQTKATRQQTLLQRSRLRQPYSHSMDRLWQVVSISSEPTKIWSSLDHQSNLT